MRRAQRLHLKNDAEILVIVRRKSHETFFTSSTEPDWITYCSYTLQESATHPVSHDRTPLSPNDPFYPTARDTCSHNPERSVDDETTLFEYEQAVY